MSQPVFAHVVGGLDSWAPLYVLVAGFVAVVASLEGFGQSGRHRSPAGRFLLRIPDALERVTAIPGWAAATVGTAMFGLLVAGVGFYNDVAWHVYTGRDKNLLTAPHTMIILGLFLIGASSLVGVLLASIGEIDTALRWRALRVPWSTVPLAVLGVTAVCGFPLDDLWHLRYGIDVTMWSPTHLLMILGASFSPLAAWLVLAEAGVRPSDGRWARGVHVAVAVLCVEGLSSAQGEFRFGVPQFQQLYLPVLLAIASGFAFVAARMILGRRWALLVGALAFATTLTVGGQKVPGVGFAQPRQTGVFVVSALAVELVAWAFGTTNRLRFAVLAGIAVATLGLAGEWAWNAHAIQPWRSPLLVSAVLVGALAAVGAAVLGLAFARSVQREASGLPRWVLVGAAVAVVVALAIPLPRRTGHVTGQIELARQGDRAVVTATLTPPSAADHSRWFQVLAWQGGGLVVSRMRRTGAPGQWVSDKAVPVAGKWKTVLRLHRGDQLVAVPLWLPADPGIPAPEVPAVTKTAAFGNEQRFLLREQTGSRDWFAALIEALLVGVAAAWGFSLVVAADRIRRRPTVGGSGRVRKARPYGDSSAVLSSVRL